MIFTQIFLLGIIYKTEL